MYDPKALETVSGEVTSIDRITPNKGMAAGIHMIVKTDKETASVHLGPSWYGLRPIDWREKLRIRGRVRSAQSAARISRHKESIDGKAETEI
jgi:hypothetical protein